MRKRVPMRFSMKWLVLIGLMAIGLTACRGRHGRRYQRLRRELPDSYRLCLFPVVTTGERATGAEYADLLQGELARTGCFRIVGPLRSSEALGRLAVPDAFRLGSEALGTLGDEIDCDAFLRARIDEDGEASLRLSGELINAYTGNPIWHRSELWDRRHMGRASKVGTARAQLVRLWVKALMADMSKLVRLQKTLLSVPSTDGDEPFTEKAPTEDAPGGKKLAEIMAQRQVQRREAVAPVPPAEEAASLQFPGLVHEADYEARGSWKTAAPAWSAGCEAVAIEAPGWKALGVPPSDAGTRFLVVELRGAEGSELHLELGDHGHPVKALRWLSDRRRALKRQRLDGQLAFAHRDGRGRAILDLELARYVMTLSGKASQSAQLVEAGRALLHANRELLDFYRSHPDEPGAPVRVERVVETRVRTVEVPKVVVPRVVLRLDRGELIELLRRSSRGDEAMTFGLPRSSAPATIPGKVDGERGSLPFPRPMDVVPRTEPAASPSPTPTFTPMPSPSPGPTLRPRGLDEEPESLPASSSPAATLHESMGLRWVAMGKFEAAREEFLAALKADPEFRRPLGQLRRLRDEHGIAFDLPSSPRPESPALPAATSTPAPSPTPTLPPAPTLGKGEAPSTGSGPVDAPPSPPVTRRQSQLPAPVPAPLRESPVDSSDGRDYGALLVVVFGGLLLAWVAFGGKGRNGGR